MTLSVDVDVLVSLRCITSATPDSRLTTHFTWKFDTLLTYLLTYRPRRTGPVRDTCLIADTCEGHGPSHCFCLMADSNCFVIVQRSEVDSTTTGLWDEHRIVLTFYHTGQACYRLTLTYKVGPAIRVPHAYPIRPRSFFLKLSRKQIWT